MHSADRIWLVQFEAPVANYSLSSELTTGPLIVLCVHALMVMRAGRFGCANAEIGTRELTYRLSWYAAPLLATSLKGLE